MQKVIQLMLLSQKHIINLISPSASIANDDFIKNQSASAKEEKSQTLSLVPANNSIEEQLWDNKAQLKQIAAEYGLSYWNQGVKSQIFLQIDWLLDSDSWEEGDALANTESFKTLIKFILNTSLVKAPSLGLSDKGNLLASSVSETGKLILECKPYERTKYIASYITNGKQKRAAGDAESIGDLLDLLSPFNNAGWFCLNGKNN